MKFEVAGLAELESAAKKILQEAKEQKIFLFYGSMGAGKTTLINKICELLGTKDHMRLLIWVMRIIFILIITVL
jgi:tRNA threonylcarbamoyladenosine biosynthesis protein TsaE